MCPLSISDELPKQVRMQAASKPKCATPSFACPLLAPPLCSGCAKTTYALLRLPSLNLLPLIREMCIFEVVSRAIDGSMVRSSIDWAHAHLCRTSTCTNRVRPSVHRPTKWSMTYFASCLFARTAPARPRSPRRPSTRARTRRPPHFFRCRLPSDSPAAAAVVVVNDGGGVACRSVGLLVGHQIIHLIYLRSFTTRVQVYNYDASLTTETLRKACPRSREPSAVRGESPNLGLAFLASL